MGLSWNLDGTPSPVSKRSEKFRQVSGRRVCAWMAVCKTVGLAYVGSNPTPATQNPRSVPVPVFPDAGSDACPGAVGRPFPVAVGQWWARSWPGQRGGGTGAWGCLPRAQSVDLGLAVRYFRRSQASHRIWSEVSDPVVSHSVQLWHGRMADEIPGVHVDSCGPAGGQRLEWRACSMCWLAIWSWPGMQWA